MYERFTDRARKVMHLATQEAQRFNHEHTGTEHILLALVNEGAGVGANVLRNLDIDPERIRLEVERIVLPGPDLVTTGKLPQTPGAKKVVEQAIEECRNLKQSYVGTEHLLLGLICEQEGVAAQVLRKLGLSLGIILEEILALLDPGISHKEEMERGGESGPQDLTVETRNWPERIRLALRELDAQIEQFTGAKEAGVTESDSEEAAHLREQEDRLKKKKSTLLRRWRNRVAILQAIGTTESPAAQAVALAVLEGDWTVLPILGDALEDAGDLRAPVVRAWAAEENG